jgi:hypothetical protein
MSLNAAAIRLMEAKGLTIGDVAEIAEAMESGRSSAAVRQARYRAKKKGSDVTNVDVTRDVTLPPYEDTSTPPVPPVEPNGSTAPKGRNDRGAKISESWIPPAIAELSPEARTLASQWPESAYRAEAEAFRNYWLAETGKSARKSNWCRAWANRIVTVNSRVMRQSGSHSPQSDLGALMASVERKYANELQGQNPRKYAAGG